MTIADGGPNDEFGALMSYLKALLHFIQKIPLQG